VEGTEARSGLSGPRTEADHAVVPPTTTTATTPNTAHGAIFRIQLGAGAGGGLVTTWTCEVGMSSRRTIDVGESSPEEGALSRLTTLTHRGTRQGYYTDCWSFVQVGVTDTA
jgi:hypothetical protein